MRTSNEPRWSIGSNGLRQTTAWWQTDAVLTVAIAHDAHVVAVTPRAAKARLVQAASVEPHAHRERVAPRPIDEGVDNDSAGAVEARHGAVISAARHEGHSTFGDAVVAVAAVVAGRIGTVVEAVSGEQPCRESQSASSRLVDGVPPLATTLLSLVARAWYAAFLVARFGYAELTLQQ